MGAGKKRKHALGAFNGAQHAIITRVKLAWLAISAS
jgi:hypothetical protein